MSKKRKETFVSTTKRFSMPWDCMALHSADKVIKEQSEKYKRIKRK